MGVMSSFCQSSVILFTQIPPCLPFKGDIHMGILVILIAMLILLPALLPFLVILVGMVLTSAVTPPEKSAPARKTNEEVLPPAAA
jgi:hypothetical protein